METFFVFLANNPGIAITIIVIICVLIMSVVIIYFVALFQGRRLSLWPPSIGPRPSKVSKKGISEDQISKRDYTSNNLPGPHMIYPNDQEASLDIIDACMKAEHLYILNNKGSSIFGEDKSVIPFLEMHKFSKLRDLNIILLNSNSIWIPTYLKSKGYSFLHEYRTGLEASHIHVINAVNNIKQILSNAKSEVRYYEGPPIWRMILTEDTAFISNYADDSQVSKLPVFRYDNSQGSFYSAFYRHYNLIWSWAKASENDEVEKQVEMSAGGIVYRDTGENRYILLVKRQDNTWVLPKGHREGAEEVELTALREIYEETGLPPEKLKIEKLLGAYADNSFADEPKVVIMFLIRYVGEYGFSLKTDLDHIDVKWWPISIPLPAMKYFYQFNMIENFIKSSTSIS
jgi:8-oxo-dGTP pyrophosphatase MutT (NUDIX family)